MPIRADKIEPNARNYENGQNLKKMVGRTLRFVIACEQSLL